MCAIYIFETEILIQLVMAGTLSHFLSTDDTLARSYPYIRKSQWSFVRQGQQPRYTDEFYNYESGTK